MDIDRMKTIGGKRGSQIENFGTSIKKEVLQLFHKGPSLIYMFIYFN
jgi:hypothetical protein